MANSALPSKDFQEGVDDDAGRTMPTDQNVLQKHVAFFDRNHDGLVYPWETFEGFRAIGAGYLLSMTGALFINAALSGKTRPGKYPSLFFPIEVKNIHMAKHGSDSGVYDHEGRVASWTEWMTLYNLCKDQRGLLRKETIRGVYDGSLFEHMERERREIAAAKKKAWM
ncbi:hypothetical protein REPUB_Repub01dG0056500 [Reevesia pubescens]